MCSTEEFYKERRSASAKNGCGATTARDSRYCWIKKATTEANAKNQDEQGTVQMNSLTLAWIYRAESGKLTVMDLLRRGAAIFWSSSGRCSGLGQWR